MTFACRAHASTVRPLSDDPFAVLGVAADASASEIAAARRRLARSAHPDRGGDVAKMQALNAAYDRALQQRPAVKPVPVPPRTSNQRVQQDAPSFTVDVAPAQAFAALTVVASWMGEVLVDDAPHILECLLDEPIRCWCRLDITPEGDASSVSLIVARYDDVAPPDIDEVRDEWVANLNRLGQP